MANIKITLRYANFEYYLGMKEQILGRIDFEECCVDNRVSYLLCLQIDISSDLTLRAAKTCGDDKWNYVAIENCVRNAMSFIGATYSSIGEIPSICCVRENVKVFLREIGCQHKVDSRVVYYNRGSTNSCGRFFTIGRNSLRRRQLLAGTGKNGQIPIFL